MVLDGLIVCAVPAFLNVCRRVMFYIYIDGSAAAVASAGLVGLLGSVPEMLISIGDQQIQSQIADVHQYFQLLVWGQRFAG